MSNQASQPIGVFDSGLGGLTILKALQQKLPNEQFIYYGDTAHLPYGEKSEEALISYVKAITDFLYSQNCKMVVVACNSAATVIGKSSNLRFDSSQIVEVISPIIKLIGSQTKYKNIGIIGTRKTIGSSIFSNGLSSLNSELKVVSKATPLLVPLIEEGFLDEQVLFPVFDKYLKVFSSCELIIPACTHYPIIYKQIEDYFNQELKVLHTPKIIAEEVEHFLKKRDLLAESKVSNDQYHLSDITDDFLKESEVFLGKEVHFNKTIV